jgi:hypothetical protein
LKIGILELTDLGKCNHMQVVVEKPELKNATRQEIRSPKNYENF